MFLSTKMHNILLISTNREFFKNIQMKKKMFSKKRVKIVIFIQYILCLGTQIESTDWRVSFVLDTLINKEVTLIKWHRNYRLYIFPSHTRITNTVVQLHRCERPRNLDLSNFMSNTIFSLFKSYTSCFVYILWLVDIY